MRIINQELVPAKLDSAIHTIMSSIKEIVKHVDADLYSGCERVESTQFNVDWFGLMVILGASKAYASRVPPEVLFLSVS